MRALIEVTPERMEHLDRWAALVIKPVLADFREQNTGDGISFPDYRAETISFIQKVKSGTTTKERRAFLMILILEGFYGGIKPIINILQNG